MLDPCLNTHNGLNGTANSITNGDGPILNHGHDPLEPIAIIGMSFQLPGEAVTEDALWEMLVKQECASSEFPSDRINIDAFYSADRSKPNTIHTRRAHFLKKDVRELDAQFFSIPPLEAGAMDPNQRGLMETTYHAIENAGITMPELRGSNTSVHVGFFTHDHEISNLRDPQRIPKYYTTGSSASILSNRISWFYDLRGASMTVDTACSSGLVALDLACQGLWAGKSDMAIVGASNVILSPELNIALSNMNFLSPHGKCFSFDHRASGYARGEGFTTLILKPLSKAITAGNTIRSVIRNVRSNQDGYTKQGITQPSQQSQLALIRQTYADAGLDMDKTRYFEAHGTGTPIGDPIEARAIGDAFRDHRFDDQPLYVGALKSNVGHLEGASGLAAVIKTVLVLEKGLIPPNTNFDKLNPAIDDKYCRIKFPQQVIPWPQEGVRRASVNCFGFGGSNCHVVLENNTSYSQTHARAVMNGSTNSSVQDHCELETQDDSFRPTLLLLSASDESGISRQIAAHTRYLQTEQSAYSDDFLANYAYTLGVCRTCFNWRSFGVIDSPNALGDISLVMSPPEQKLGGRPQMGFVFTGQGAQWHGMGKELLSQQVFRESIAQSQNYLDQLGCAFSIRDRLANKKHMASIGEALYGQTLTTAIQLALVDLLEWLGMKPSVVIGHSSGEIAAAYAAGLISHSSAIKISYFRGLLGSRLETISPTRWSMAAIGLSLEDADSYIKELEASPSYKLNTGTLTISCINSPCNVTVSGPVDELDILVDDLSQRNVFARKLKVTIGYHSPQMTLISDEYLAMLGEISPRIGGPEHAPVMVSSVTGKIVDGLTVCDGLYWSRNMVSPVNFVGAMRCCTSSEIAPSLERQLTQRFEPQISPDAWLEIGPHSALQGPIREILSVYLPLKKPSYVSALTRYKSALSSVLTAGGYLHCRGFKLDISRLISLGFHPSKKASLKTLPQIPGYQFNHSKTYWEEPSVCKNLRLRKHGTHELLGCRITEPNALESQWKFIIKEDDMPWVRDHKVNDAILYPAAGMIVMAIEAAKELLEDHPPVGLEMRNVSFPAPIMLASDPEGVEVRIHMSSSVESGNSDPEYKFRIFIQKPDNSQQLVCLGTLHADYGYMSSNTVDPGKAGSQRVADLDSEIKNATQACRNSVERDELYQSIRDNTGIDYGPDFQALNDVQYSNAGQAIASILPLAQATQSSFTVHPSRLDSVFQLAFAGVSAIQPPQTMVPHRINKIWISVSGFGKVDDDPTKAFTQVKEISNRHARMDIKTICQSDSSLKLDVSDLEVTAITSSAEVSTSVADAKYLCSHMHWNIDIDAMTSNELSNHCESVRVTEHEPVEWYENMDALVFEYAARALRDIDTHGKTIAPSMEKYARWLRSRVNTACLSPPLSEEQLAFMSSKVLHTTRGEMHMTVGQNLSAILEGHIDPLEIIFNDDAKITNFYKELMEDTTGLDPFNCYLDALVHKNPGLKFVEVGAGTGSSTKVILDTIAESKVGPRFGEYVYTDISPFFFDKAREKFVQHHPRIKYQVLNIEQDVSAQGFVPGTYDVVVADNVLHATKDIRTTLKHIRQLLKTGGKLILKELVNRDRLLVGLMFGLLPGWWLAHEKEREMSPLLPEERWHELLKECGFTGNDQIFRDHATESCRVWSIMISTAAVAVNGTLEYSQVKKDLPPIFILDTSSSLQRQTATEIIHNLDAAYEEASLLTLAEAAQLSDESLRSHGVIFLNEMERPVLSDIGEEDFVHLQRCIKHAGSMVWVKQGGGGNAPSSPEYAASDGLARVFRLEHTNAVLVTLALEDHRPHSFINIAKVYQMSQDAVTGVSPSFEPEYCERRGKLCINRLTKASSLNEHVFKRTEQPVLRQQIGDKRLALGIRAPGLLDTIQFSEEQTPKLPPGPDEVDVEVWAIGVNFKDCLGLLGRVNTAEYGTECVGIVKEVGAGITEFKIGDRVASGEPNCFKTWIRSHVNNVVKLPESMPFAEAGAIPTQFLTAYHSIMYVARARKGQTILVHSAAGGTGQAMVQVAQYVGAEVFCTVGSAAKKKLLQEVYDIPEDHIFFSRDTSFADGIKRMTGGRGVDIVINSLSGHLLKATWECIAAFGHFIDIGLKDAFMGNDLPMQAFANNATFSGVNLAPLCQSRDGHNKKVMQEVLDLFEKGVFKIASPLQTYPLEETEKAFRFLATGQSSGKMVITVDREATLPVVQHSASDFHFDNSTYVIAGGLGGIGRKMARWLVQRGARNLILLSRSGPHGNLHAEAMLAEFEEMGVKVQCPACDITDLTSLKDALKDCSKTMPPIRGCIQAAMVLSDTTFTDMNIHQWRQATRPKIQGSWNLHLALPSGMDFFVLLSSCCGVCGNGGQSNYAAGNTYQDALAGYRTSVGEKTISLDIGVVRGEGFFEHNQQLMDRLLRLDMLSPTSDNEIFAIMDYYCNPSKSNVEPFQSQAIMGFNLPADIEAKGKDIPTPMHQPLFRYMLQSPGSGTRSDTSRTSKQSFKTTFANATTAAEGALIAAEAMREKLSKMLGLQPENLGIDESLTTVGADSLVGLELRNWLAKEAGADVAVFEILGDISLRSVGELVALRTSFRPEGWTEG